MKAAKKLLALALAILAAGCDPQPPSKASTQNDELLSLRQRVGNLEVSVSALNQSVETLRKAPPGVWTLWQVSEALNAGYPQAFSAYASKTDCLAAANGWSYAGGKVVGQDPTIWQMKGYRMRLECLPAGTQPYAH